MERRRVVFPVPDIPDEELVESKLPDVIARVVPEGFPVGFKVTVVEVVKILKLMTVGERARVIVVDATE